MPCVFDIREIIKNGNMVDGNIMDFRLREIGGNKNKKEINRKN